MTLETGDRELFVLAELLNKDGSESGTRILFDYWKGKDRFSNLQSIIGKVPEIKSIDQIQYLFASEHICRRLVESMSKFISGPVCGKMTVSAGISSEAGASGRELIYRMEALQKLDAHKGWESFHKELLECAASIIRELDSLTFLNAGDPNVRICTNATIDSVFSKRTSYRDRIGTFFVFEV